MAGQRSPRGEKLKFRSSTEGQRSTLARLEPSSEGAVSRHRALSFSYIFHVNNKLEKYREGWASGAVPRNVSYVHTNDM